MSSIEASHRTKLVKDIILNHGFLNCGISESGFLANESQRLETWLTNGHHGSMQWMENHFDKRLDTQKLVEGSKSVISMTFNYFPEKTQDIEAPKIAKYAYGEDYHFVLKDKMRSIVEALQTEIGEFSARVFVDSAPVMERAWAAKSGLGWIGKHSLLLSKKQGSFFFIAQIICDLELDYDAPVTDHCGSCTACIDACPTDAIIDNQIVDANKCISYLTIELKDQIPTQFKGQMEDWVFGCDICQDVCPWNRFSKPHHENRFKPRQEIMENNWSDWEEITEDVFKDVFKKSAIKRTKYSGFLRNLQFANKQ
ncbi:MAG: epoxyqueuosine reductase [Bacteroidia bacterium]